jgi:hypothetical protein
MSSTFPQLGLNDPNMPAEQRQAMLQALLAGQQPPQPDPKPDPAAKEAAMLEAKIAEIQGGMVRALFFVSSSCTHSSFTK